MGKNYQMWGAGVRESVWKVPERASQMDRNTTQTGQPEDHPGAQQEGETQAAYTSTSSWRL